MEMFKVARNSDVLIRWYSTFIRLGGWKSDETGIESWHTTVSTPNLIPSFTDAFKNIDLRVLLNGFSFLYKLIYSATQIG